MGWRCPVGASKWVGARRARSRCSSCGTSAIRPVERPLAETWERPRASRLVGYEPVVHAGQAAHRRSYQAMARRCHDEESLCAREAALLPSKRAAARASSSRTPSASASVTAAPVGRGSGVSSKTMAPSRVARRALTCRLCRSKKRLVVRSDLARQLGLDVGPRDLRCGQDARLRRPAR